MLFEIEVKTTINRSTYSFLFHRMISTKKILEGCLLAVSKDVSEKWNLFLEGTEFVEDENSQISKSACSKVDYNEHLIPLYKLAGKYNVNLRAGLSSASVASKQRKLNNTVNDFPEWMNRLSLLREEESNQQEDWVTYIYGKVRHTTLVIRDKQYVRAASTNIVVGDIVYASAGDIVAADVRVIVSSVGAKVDMTHVVCQPGLSKELGESPTDTDPL